MDEPSGRCPVCRGWYRTGYAFCPSDGAALVPDAADPLLGATIADRYEIEALIGSGATGRVYRARHLRLSRRFAVKVLRDGAIGGDTARLRFRREAEAASRLHHDHLVGVVDTGETEAGLPYLVMDLAPGETLAALLGRDGPLSRARTIRLFRQIADGLAHAHKAGLVHRDLKPGNIIVEPLGGGEEHVRIVDFGLALADGGSLDRLTTVGMVVGTPAYLSPEQATGAAVDHRTDLYSLGVTLYHALSGTVPFDGPPLEVAQEHVCATPPRIAGRNVDRLLEALAFWLMEKRPDARPQDAVAVRELLDLVDRSPAAASEPLAAWIAPSTGRMRAMWRQLDGSTTAPIEALPAPTPAPNFSATDRAWPPTMSPAVRTRRMGKLAIGSAPPDAWGRVGAVINQRLRIGRIIGLGPHGTVYEADDLAEARKVALKVLHPRLAPAEELPRAEAEVRLAPMFGHPALVELDALGRLDDGAWYVVTALVQGTDLASLLADGALAEDRALRLVRGALAALEPAHRNAAAHGDLKPENLIVGDGDAVHVLDVGLTRLFRRGAASELARETGPYAAPEVASTGLATPRGDVFALGTVLAELLGVEREADAVHLVSRETGFILWRATQKDPRDRFRDATEMRACIDAALRTLER